MTGISGRCITKTQGKKDIWNITGYTFSEGFPMKNCA